MAHNNIYLGLAHGRCHWPGSSSVVLIHKFFHSRFQPQGAGLIWDIQKGSWQELCERGAGYEENESQGRSLAETERKEARVKLVWTFAYHVG